MNEKNPAAPPAGVLQPQSIQSTYPTLHTHTNSTHSTPTSLSHVLCSTDIYKVTGPSVMPCSFSRLMSSFDSPENTRVFMPNNTPWVLITHKHRVQLHCYNRDYPTATAITDITFPMPVECLNAPYCILLPDKESLFDQTLVLVTGHGIVLVWSSIIAAAHQLTQHTTHTLTLEQHEQIVAVTHVSSTQAIVGTCKGHLFLLNVIDHGNENKNTNRHGIELSSVAMDRSNTLSDRLSPWLPAALTRLTGVFMKEKSSVLKLIPLQQHGQSRVWMGVLTRDTLQLWEISMPMPKLISRVDLLPCIKKYITKELLSGDLEDEVQIRAFDMSAYKARQLVMVVSYYIPSMGEYCQFAVLVFQIHEVFTQQDHSVIEHEYIIQDAISLPYSAIMQCMKRTPTISVSGDSDIAFVTFEDTVVSVGLSRRSTFEVSIHLKPTTGNVFLAALAQPTTSIQGNDLSSTEALVFTTQSGILSLQINSPAALSASESLMNGSSTKDRSTALLEDRLKQAVFFEDQKQSPLYFPLAIECGRGDLQAAALSLARTLLHGSSSLMTPETDTHPYPLSRYKYIVNIAKILNKYNLIDELRVEARKELLHYAETSLEIFILWKHHFDQRKDTANSSDLYAHAIAIVVEPLLGKITSHTTLDTDALINDFVASKTSSVDSFLATLDELQNTLPYSNMEKHRIRSRANHLVLSAVYEMSSFGDICLENYHLSEMKEQKTAKHCVLLKDAIEKTLFFLPQGIISKKRPLETSVILSIKTEALEDDHDLEQVLCQQIFAMAKLVLSLSGSESLTDQVSIEPLSKIQAFAIKSVFRAGFKEQALQLAEQYKDFDTFMEVIQSENAQVAQTLLEQNLSTYGKEFACYLCQWYTEQDQQEKILKIDAMYGDIVEEFLKGKNLSIEWMYYMKLGNYTKMYSALETVIPKETNLKKKKLLYSNAKLAYIASQTECPPHRALPEVLSSSEAVLIKYHLLLLEAQEFLASCFDTRWRRYGVKETHVSSKTGYIVSQVAKRLSAKDQTKKYTHFHSLVESLCAGNALSCRDFIDVLILMDNTSSQDQKGLITALRLTFIIEQTENPTQAKDTINDIWKSIYTKDNWTFLRASAETYTKVELQVCLRQTILFKVLALCNANDISEQLILSPQQVGFGMEEVERGLSVSQQKDDLLWVYREILDLLKNQ